MIEIELPYPPSVNHYYRHVGHRVLISREGRRYREAVVAILAGMILRPLAGPLALRVDLYPPDNRRRDIDNCLKAIADSLQHGGAYLYDSQIVDLHVRKVECVLGGRAIVRMGEASQP